MPPPNGAHSAWQNKNTLLAKFIGYTNLAQCRIVYRHLYDGLLNMFFHTVLDDRHTTGNLQQSEFFLLFVQLFETIKAITTVAYDLAGS